MSLRSLMVVVGVLCLIGGHYANRLHQRRQVTKMVTRYGGQIEYRQADRRPRNPRWFDRLLLPQVDEVSLFLASVPDAELSVLRHCRRLRRLNLNYSTIGDRGLMHVAELSSLRWLGVKRTQVTDAGMRSLARLDQLESLILDGTGLTDAGLRQLESLGSLKYLAIRRTDVSDAGVVRFRRTNPTCRVAR